MIAVTVALAKCLGGTAHFLIAEKYRTISEKIPQTFAGQAPKEEGCRAGMKVLFWLNILIPLCWGVTLYFFINADLNGKEAQKPVIILNGVATELMGLVQIVTGIILVRSVFKIRSFFKARNDEDCIDTTSLVQHAVSFVLYTATLILYYTAWMLHTILQENAIMFKTFLVSVFVKRIGSLISLLLLCVIFWRLGCKDDEEDA